MLPSPSPVSAGANLILNPGFEEPSGGNETGGGNQTPTNWTASTTTPFRSLFPDVHSGSFAAYLHGTSGSYTQTVYVGASSIYRFESYARANSSANEVVTLTIRDSSGVALDTYSGNGTDHGWVRRIEYLTTPPRAWDAVVTLSISGNAGAEAWFDDIVLEEKTPSWWCFIATAAHGSYIDPSVGTLRTFRDGYLMTNAVGRGLVSTYYKISPPVAQFIGNHPMLKPVVRAGLLPAVALSSVAMDTTLAIKVVAVVLVMLITTVLIFTIRKRYSSSKSRIQ